MEHTKRVPVDLTVKTSYGSGGWYYRVEVAGYPVSESCGLGAQTEQEAFAEGLEAARKWEWDNGAAEQQPKASQLTTKDADHLFELLADFDNQTVSAERAHQKVVKLRIEHVLGEAWEDTIAEAEEQRSELMRAAVHRREEITAFIRSITVKED